MGTKKFIYDNYLKNIDSNISYRLELSDALFGILNSGVVPILAHPKEIQDEFNVDILKFIEVLTKKWIAGIEVYNSIHSLLNSCNYQYIANQFGLLTTGGSDYHGLIVKRKVDLGSTTTEKIKIYKKDINFFDDKGCN
ncbi:MAG: hypothetical protein RR847_03735 [Bacilli bacterium]